MQHTAYIALGSNIEPRAATIIKALTLINARQDVSVVRISRLIETEPVGPVEQGKFLNGAAELQTTLGPTELLHALLEIEAKLGRDRSREEHWGPRTCDLDVLLYDDVVLNEPELTIPHRLMHERIFVLKPLCQIAPGLEHPVLRRTISQLLADLEGS